MNNGASVPPLVPLPSETDQEMNFMMHRKAKKPASVEPVGCFAERMSLMLKYPTPNVRGAK